MTMGLPGLKKAARKGFKGGIQTDVCENISTMPPPQPYAITRATRLPKIQWYMKYGMLISSGGKGKEALGSFGCLSLVVKWAPFGDFMVGVGRMMIA